VFVGLLKGIFSASQKPRGPSEKVGGDKLPTELGEV
jgi:hypothetical protein